MGVILIAYERESEQIALEQLLSARGHQVVKASNGLAALEAARRDPPHVIVADIVLPHMDGFALCRKWKQDERLETVPFFFYTRRHDDPKYERFALELGAERFFARTVQPDALLNAIDDLVARSRRTSETSPLPALEESVEHRAQEQERLQQEQQLLLQRAQQAQAALHKQVADLQATNLRLTSEAARLQEQMAMQGAIFGGLAEGCLALDADGRVLEVNATYCRMAGYSRESLLRMNFADLEPQDASNAAARRDPHGGERYETKLKRRDGSMLEVELSIGRLQHAIADRVLVVRDITKVLQARRVHTQTLSLLQRADLAIQGTIDALLRVTEIHDPHTAGSARRIAALAVALGREAGLDGERQHALRVAALLHDIGNVAVPAAILAKPAQLTAAETALMRTHVEEGRKLLAAIDFGAPIAEIVFEHHERYDGSGYPRGLQGEEIMIEARILAIADMLEALCSARSWRAARAMGSALDEIDRGAGTLFDRQLVAACTRLVREQGFSL